MHPLIFLEYPKHKKIIEEIKITKKRKLSPLETNCDMMWLLTYLDLKDHNYSIYIEYLCNQIRQEKISRLKWSILLPMGIWMLKHRLIKRKQIKNALDYLNLTLKDIK
jgi:hypothetical protein